jgi:hypothetical protein
VKERPILFRDDMVRAILAGTKTQTRRLVKPQPPSGVGVLHCGEYAPVVIDRHGDEQPGVEVWGAYDDDGEWGNRSPYGGPGDRLWVRETHALTGGTMPAQVFDIESADGVVYRADRAAASFTGYADGRAWLRATTFGDEIEKWRPSIFMPRWASRITLEVTDVRVQRLQDISEDPDARADGGCVPRRFVTEPNGETTARREYEWLWDRINGDGSSHGEPVGLGASPSSG